MATTRLLRPSRTLHSFQSSSYSSSYSVCSLPSTVASRAKCLKPTAVAAFGGDQIGINNGFQEGRPSKVKPVVKALAAAAAGQRSAIAAAEHQTSIGLGVDLVSTLVSVTNTALVILRSAVKRRPKKMNIQIFIEKVIIDCRFFTLLAVGGTLLGSILCFLEGSFGVLESYLEYFRLMTHGSSYQGNVVLLLIEALDMFLVGTAMLTFGVSLHAMFVKSKSAEDRGPWLSGSNLFGLYYLTRLPAWVEMQSVSQAKSRIGQAVMMILQVGVLEKFKSIPVVTGLDLACFAGAVLLSSASIFLLSRLSFGSSSFATRMIEKQPVR